MERKYWDVLWDSIAAILGFWAMLSMSPTYSSSERGRTPYTILVCFYVFITLETILKLFFIGKAITS